MIRYVVYVKGGKDQEGELPVGEYVVGRSRSADIHIPEPDVSGRHLKVVVDSGGAWVENLSSHGTTCDGRSLRERETLADGTILRLGKSTEVRFEMSAPAGHPELPADSATVIPDAPAPVSAGAKGGDATVIPENSVAADGDATVIPGNSVAADRSAAATSDARSPDPAEEQGALAPGADEVQKTDVMHTRLASLEEMNLLRSSDRKRTTGKLFRYVLFGVLAVAALTLLYTLRPAQKEQNLSWPVDADDNVLGAFYDPGVGGHTGGAFSLAFPSIKGKTDIRKLKDRIVIDTRCGKDASVPLRIIFVERRSADFLTLERKAVFTRMLGELQRGEERRWNVSQISDVFFIGADNGLPCLSCEYRREADKESWYGEVLFFRTGDRAYIRLAETLVSERARAQNFISNTPFLKFSLSYLHCHWEGNPEYRGGDPTVMLDEVSRHLSKQAPFEWARTYLLLQNTLMESVRTDNPVYAKDALAQLQRLRTMQSVWYNSQKIQYDTAKLYDDKRQENAILELCKTVFSSPDDLRYFTLRRNVWE